MKDNKPKWFWGISFFLLALACNEFVAHGILSVLGWEIPEIHQFAAGQGFIILDIAGVWFAVQALWMVKGKGWKELGSTRGRFWLIHFLTVWFVIQASNPVMAGRFSAIRIVAYLFALFLLTKAFHLGVIRKAGGQGRKQNIWAMGMGIAVLWIVLEIVFLFVPGTHNTIESLASRIWFQRYWQVNSLGYRDPAWDFEAMKSKYKVLLVGDSFTQGHGIRNPKDRFGDLLQQKWGESYAVLNLGTLGYGPELELENLEMFPQPADAVLLVWYVNDIHDAALRNGFNLDAYLGREQYRPRTLNPIKTSYLVNYLYWSFPHPQTENNYTDFLKAAFRDSATLADHLIQLDHIAAHCEQRSMKLAVLMFPMMGDVSGSSFAIDPVKAHFQQRNIPVLDISPLVLGKTPKELMVSKNDAHPNEWVNSQVADTLAPFLEAAWDLPH